MGNCVRKCKLLSSAAPSALALRKEEFFVISVVSTERMTTAMGGVGVAVKGGGVAPGILVLLRRVW